MPLIERDDSALVVVDTQPAFVNPRSRTAQDRSTAAGVSERLIWLAGIANLLEIPAVVVEEGRERAGATLP